MFTPRPWVALTVIGLAAGLHAQDGQLLQSFGVNGIARNYITWENDPVAEAVCQPDGKIITVSKYTDQFPYSGVAYLCRFGLDGYLDPTYGTGGKAEINFCTSDDFVLDLLLQPDGKVVGCGFESFLFGDPSIGQAVTFRVDTTGALDTTYGIGGITYLMVSFQGDSEASTIALSPDGSIIGAGYDWDVSGYMFLFKYDTNGQRDTTFGNYGVVTLPNALIQQPKDIALQPDGKILVTGWGTFSDLQVMRFHPDGSIDGTFGVNGLARTSILGNESSERLHLYPDGRILVGGRTSNPMVSPTNNDIGLVRFMPSGVLDPTFGIGGRFSHGYSSSLIEYFKDMALLPDGRIVVAVYEDITYPGADFAVMCVGPDGGVVNSWGNDGLAGADESGSFVSKSVCVRPDGMVVCAGDCPSINQWGVGGDIGLACFVPDSAYTIVGITERNAADNAIVFPTPATGGQAITVRGIPPTTEQVQFIGADGRIRTMLFERSGNDVVIPASATRSLAPGMYLARGLAGGKDVWRARVVLQ